MPSLWQISYSGVTQTFAQWGAGNLQRKVKSAQTGVCTFSLVGFPMDGALPFAQWQPLTILKDGAQWFTGWVTRTPRKGTTQAESIEYEISDAWYWLEKTVFQQMWTSYGPGGIGQVTTAQSSVIVGQSLTGLKLSSGQVIAEALLYCQYAFQGQPFPATTVTAEQTDEPASWWPPQLPTTFLLGLPPPPNPALGALPFQIGVITPSIVTTYSETRDKSCADIIRLVMKYSPDAVAWIDYSTTPATIHVDRRGNLPVQTVSVFNETVKLVSAFDATGRYDLQVPAVLVKFQTTDEVNGKQTSILVVDQYPPGVPDNACRNWVSTVDLVGSKTTTQSATVVARERPIDAKDNSVMSWILKKDPFLKQNPLGKTDTYIYDWALIGCALLQTTIDKDDPLNVAGGNPNDITLPDCPQLVNELLSSFPGWLQDSDELDSAKVLVEVWLKYSGSDALTKSLFWFDPNNPTVPLTDGSGYLRRWYHIKATNAGSETYTHLTNYTAGEPVPQGWAQYLYECMAPLHWEGQIEMTEDECSNQLPIGCVFNATEAPWTAMNALVLGVTEKIDLGITSVTFGPPLMLGLQELEELFRANEGLRPSYHLQQRTDGQTSSGANVTDAKHAGESAVSSPPAPASTGSSYVGPFSITTGKNTDGTFWALINLNSNLWPTTGGSNSNIAITGLNTKIKLTPNDTFWLLGTFSDDGATVSAATIHNYGSGASDYSATAVDWTAGGEVENNGATPPVQTLFRRQIAIFVADAHGTPQLTQQRTTTDLRLFTTMRAYLPAIYPWPN